MKETFAHNLLNEFRKTFKLGTPVIIGNISHMLMGIVDSVMIGHVGVIPLAAASFANSLFFFFIVFNSGLAAIISSLVARAIGKNDDREAGSIFRHGFIVSLIVSLILFTLLRVVMINLAIFGQSPEINEEAYRYLNIISYSIIPISLYFTYQRFCEGTGETRVPMLFAWAAVIINVPLNWILIFGHLGFSKWGLSGAGMATLIARVSLLIMMILFIHSAKRFKRYKPNFRFTNFRPYLLWRIAKLGVPSGMQFVNEIGVFATAALMMGWISPNALAAHQIAISVASLAFMVPMGISVASSVRVGNAWGKKDLATVRLVGFSSQLATIVIMLLIAIVFMALRFKIPTWYIDDRDVILIVSELMVICACLQVFDGLQSVGLGLLRGLTDVKIPLWYTVVAYWLVCLPIMYSLGFIADLGPNGIWWGLLCGMLTSSLLMNLRFHNLTKRLLAYR